MKRRSQVFAPLRHPDMRLLWLAQLLSELGNWAARLALAVLLFDRTGSPTVSALATAANLAPWIGIGQVLATMGDRLNRRTVMIATDIARAALFLLMASIPSPGAVLLLAFVAGLAAPPFEAARSALIPHAVPREQYPDALALTGTTYQLAIIAGVVFGGGLIGLGGASWALTVNAASFLASAAVLSRLRVTPGPARTDRVTSTLRSAWAAIIADPYVRRAVSFFAIIAGAAIVVEALLPAYLLAETDLSGSSVGLAAAIIPAATLAATVMIPVRGDPRQLLRNAAFLSGACAVVGAVLFAVRAPLPLLLIAFVAAGAMFASGVPANAVAGTRIPDEVRASAFGILSGVLQGSTAAGAAAGGLIATHVGMPTTCALAMLLAFAASGWSLLSVARHVPEPASTRVRTSRRR